MIPVLQQPEPPDFEALVRQPGKVFLQANPNPSSWGNREYWQKALPRMRKAYKKLCSYSAQWIPKATGNHSIEHYLPKDKHPLQAYEWDNFRYVSARFNSRKGIKAILDPFQIGQNWFVIDFTSFFVKPNSDLNFLSDSQKQLVRDTIEILKLNDDDDLVEERKEFFDDYKSQAITFLYLEKKAPFIAHEVKRQGLLNT